MTHTDTGAALLRGILERPGDAVRRLVFADWLEENGEEEYGSFIRVQCELAELDATVVEIQYRPRRAYGTGVVMDWDRWDALRQCEKDLWDGGVWKTAVLFDWDTGPNGTGQPHLNDMSRGFMSEVCLTLRQFLGGSCQTCYPPGSETNPSECDVCHGTGRVEGDAGALFAAHPIERVVLTDREPWQINGSWSWMRDTDDLAYACHDRDIYFQASGHADYKAALDALSRAACAYGRSLAGLGALPPQGGKGSG